MADKITLSVLKADVGGLVEHTSVHPGARTILAWLESS